MIQGFADPETELIWSGQRSRRLPADIQNVALRKLRLLNQARVRGELRVPPGNRLEALKADRQGQHSIRINDSGGYASSGEKEDRRMSKSSTTTSRGGMLRNPHPRENLLEEVLNPMGLSHNGL